MQWLLIVFFASLLFGQLGAITIVPGATLYIHDIVLVIVLVAGMTQIKKKHKPVALMPIAGFVMVGCLSLIVNWYRFSPENLAISSLYLLRWGFYAGLYIVLMQLPISSAFLVSGLYVVGSGISILGFIQYIWYPVLQNLYYLGWDRHYYRLFSTLLDPNFTGILIVLTVLLGFYILSFTRRWWIYVLQFVNIIALLLTHSRSSYLAFIAGILVWVMVKKSQIKIAGIIVFIIAVLLLPKPGGNTLNLLRSDSTLARIGNWRETLVIIGKSPIIGYGFNTLRYVHMALNPVLPDAPVSRAVAGVDSSILFIWATTGLIGLAVFGLIIRSIVQLCLKKKSPFILRVLFVSVLTAVTVHSLFVNSLFYSLVMIWLWVFVASCERRIIYGT